MDYAVVSQKLDAVENEMKRLGIDIPGNVEPEAVTSAFGGAEMAFERWLATVFLPAARRAVTAKDLPKRSQVGVAAMRNFDGYDDMNDLVTLLNQFDRAVEAATKGGRND